MALSHPTNVSQNNDKMSLKFLHNNRIKFSNDLFRYFPVHQHGRRDVTWKPRIVVERPN